MESKNLSHVQRYFRAIEESAPDETMRAFFAPEVVQEEFPNRLVPNGVRRDLAALLEAGRRGRDIVVRQRYEILHAIEDGDQIALEVQWSGVFKIPIGSLAPGHVMRARIAVFITMLDGRIVSQRNYDCFEPF